MSIRTQSRMSLAAMYEFDRRQEERDIAEQFSAFIPHDDVKAVAKDIRNFCFDCVMTDGYSSSLFHFGK